MSDLVTDPKAPLSKKELKAFTAKMLEGVNWNATGAGIDASHDRGYNAESVVQGMIGDLLKEAEQHGVDVVHAVFWALAMHHGYGRIQGEQAGRAAALLDPLLTGMAKSHAQTLGRIGR